MLHCITVTANNTNKVPQVFGLQGCHSHHSK